MAELRIYLLGTPRIEIDNHELMLPRRKGLAILVYLAMTREAQRRDSLATLFWPESSQSGARSNLRGALFSLRNALQGDWLLMDGEHVSLDWNADIWVDALEYRASLHNQEHETALALERVQAAVELYRDDFLTGFSLNDCPEFDDWQFFEADGFRQELLNSLDKLIENHRQQGNAENAISYARRRLAMDVLDESAHRTLMELYALAGQQSAAFRQYKECIRIFEEEFGAPPEESTTALYEAIRTRRFTDAPQEVVAQKSPATKSSPRTVYQSPEPQHNLPAQATAFIGREAETDAILTMVRDANRRLITITGPGGIGKTRLGLTVAQAALTDFPDGVWFVPLAHVESPDAIPAVISTTLSVKAKGGDIRQTLFSHLRNCSLLLVLDNFEHLLDGATFLADLLHHAPQLKLLVTSQERLNLLEESLFPLHGLTITHPNSDGDEDGAALLLFEEAARRVSPAFSLNEEKSNVIAICEAVAGLPLAIELAASWVRALSCAEIVVELEKSPEILHSTLRNVPERHRSMRTVFERSWMLLTKTEQKALRQLSVFQGSFDRDSALAVAGTTPQLLVRLIDRSLIQRLPHDHFGMHGLLHQFTADMLANIPTEEVETYARYSDYFVELLATMPWILCRPEEVADEWQQRDKAHAWIVLNFANVENVWRREIQRRNVTAIHKMKDAFADCLRDTNLVEIGKFLFDSAISALNRPEFLSNPENKGLIGALLLKRATFMQQDELHERLELIEKSLPLLHKDTKRHQIDIAHAIQLRGSTFSDLGQKKRAVKALENALALFTEAKHHSGVAHITLTFGHLQWGWGELRSASHSLHRAAELFRSSDEQTSHLALANIAAVNILQGKYSNAEELLQRCSTYYAKLKQTHPSSFYILQLQGDLATAMGRFTEAERLFALALDGFEGIGQAWVTQLFGYLNRGALFRLQGKHAEAEEFLEECLQTAHQLGWKQGEVVTLNHLSFLQSDKQDYEHGLLLAEKALSIARSISQQFGAATSLCQIGHCRLALQQREQATAAFAEALVIAVAEDIDRVACNVLTGVAQLMTNANKFADALTLFHFVLQYEASEWEVKQRSENQREILHQQVTTKKTDDAKPLGQSLSLEAAIDIAQTYLGVNQVPNLESEL